MFDLIVTHAFADYAVGDRITDATEIETMSDPSHPHARMVVRTAKLPAAEPAPAEADKA